ncbi:hypothetical protein Ddye_008334 [Dipteronia dyeriana]|uniref:Syntaxin 6/10/61 N-terminal domain-containing protein n=1 Tax=Dipteronia dyeriana TaxID=168575 RepID=A0AAD9X9L9_9ROSI|nr:hypothetical protein Ddye_008334 [Dipteronia dyeriana]
MTSSLQQWESHPLFSAAEVVQDSADRMESIYRLLLHEQSLVNQNHPDPRLLTQIDYHRRDLATILETTKWQLEDFERAVNSSAVMDKSRTAEDVISRHKQFIIAIREQINQLEKTLDDPSRGKSIRSWVNLNEQDGDGLALFLSGGNPLEQVNHHIMEDSSILRRFLDPTTASSSKDGEIVEHKSVETKNVKMNGVSHVERNYGPVKENNLRKVGSHYSTRLSLDALDSLQETSCSRHNEDESWDLEANGVKPKRFFPESKLRRHCSSMNIFGYLNSLQTAYGSRGSRNYTKRLKDGEEGRNSPSFIDVSHVALGNRMGISLASRDNFLLGFCSRFPAKATNLCAGLGACKAIYQRFPYHVQVNGRSVQMILAALSILTVLCILVHRVA